MSTINESLFLKPIKEGSPLKCSLCLGVQDDPQRLGCGHIFCKICITQLMEKTGEQCPLDRKPFTKTEIVPERYLKSIIEELDVYCKNKENGCTWEGKRNVLSGK